MQEKCHFALSCRGILVLTSPPSFTTTFTKSLEFPKQWEIWDNSRFPSTLLFSVFDTRVYIHSNEYFCKSQICFYWDLLLPLWCPFCFDQLYEMFKPWWIRWFTAESPSVFNLPLTICFHACWNVFILSGWLWLFFLFFVFLFFAIHGAADCIWSRILFHFT